MGPIRCRVFALTAAIAALLTGAVSAPPAAADPAPTLGGSPRGPPGVAAAPPPLGSTPAGSWAEDGERSRHRAGAAIEPRQAWTRDRMLAARPLLRPLAARSDGAQRGGFQRPDVSPGALPAWLPPVAAERAPSGAVGGRSAGLDPEDLIFGPAAVAVAPRHYGVYPYVTMGRLFVRFRGRDYFCSAASIGGHAIWTSGYCLHDGSGSESGWSDDAVFVPAYRAGNGPYGVWSWATLLVPRRWYLGPPSDLPLSWDYGAVILKRNSARRSISQVVGGLGFTYNQRPTIEWLAAGWPTHRPYTGGALQQCRTRPEFYDPTEPEPHPIGIRCDAFSDGSPWIATRPRDRHWYLGGNSSYTALDARGQVAVVLGPYFDAAAAVFRNRRVIEQP